MDKIELLKKKLFRNLIGMHVITIFILLITIFLNVCLFVFEDDFVHIFPVSLIFDFILILIAFCYFLFFKKNKVVLKYKNKELKEEKYIQAKIQSIDLHHTIRYTNLSNSVFCYYLKFSLCIDGVNKDYIYLLDSRSVSYNIYRYNVIKKDINKTYKIDKKYLFIIQNDILITKMKPSIIDTVINLITNEKYY